MSLDDFQERVGKWAEATFPHATDQSVAAHLTREVRELRALCDASLHEPVAHDEYGGELADCFLLLLHLAHRLDLSLFEEAAHKFSENQHRKWGTPDAEGVVEHIREGAV